MAKRVSGKRRIGVRPPSPPEYDYRIEEAWIPMADGTRLSANLFLPDGRAGERFPVLLEYLPYRKDDWGYARDVGLNAYWARRGYVGVRLDIRGTGRSEGLLPDREYSEQEQRDGLEAIGWLSQQPWSTGAVGMYGISWSGFNAIHLAMRRPPALKAILAIQATDDLFQDDIHYIDGLMHVDEYEIAMDENTSITRAPDFPVDEESLAARFDRPPWKLLWLKHQRDGPFWKTSSLIADYSKIRVPVFLIAGWYDGYRDSVPRMLEHLRPPTKAIVGPWNHTFPHDAVPGPRIEWRREAVRWWDHWLKGRASGILDEPRLAVYVRRWHPPDVTLDTIPGEWRYEDGWPIRRIKRTTWYLCDGGRLALTRGRGAVHELAYVPSAGSAAGFWWGDLVPDQRPADAHSLTYDSEPLGREVEILGTPRAILRGSASARLAHWFARLSDVAPDGTVTLVAGAGLNGAHRETAARPKVLRPGQVYTFPIDLHFTSWVFPKGHRIRVAVSNALWPMIWPTPYAMTTSLEVGGRQGSWVELPVVPPAEKPRPAFRPPEPVESPVGYRSVGETWPGRWTVTRDAVRRRTVVEWAGTSVTEFPWGRMTHREEIVHAVQDDRPDMASVSGKAETRVDLRDRILTWRGFLDLRSDATKFYYKYRRELLRDGQRIRERSWDEATPRDHQ